MDEKIVIQQKPVKSPAAAGILSVILPGLGNIYNGFANKGLLYLVVFAGLLALLITAATAGNAVAIVFTALMLGGFWFYQIIDSVNTAKALNLAALKQEPEVTPKAEELPALVTSGSIFWGAVLIVIGVLAILANFDVIRWETLWDFWPLAVIVIGLKLVFDSVAKAKKNGKDAN